MSGARRHHYVPAFYLAQFADPPDRHDGRLHVHDLVTGRTFRTSPDKTGHERDFYRVEVDAQPATLVEDAIAKLENLVAPVIKRVIDREMLPVDAKELRTLLAFVAIQAIRTPSTREAQAENYSSVHMLFLETLANDKRAFEAEWRKGDRGLTPDEINAEFDDLVRFVNSPGARVDMDQTTLIGDALKVAPDIEDALALRSWVLGVLGRVTDEARFITTDDPVLLDWNGLPPAPTPLSSPGFLSTNAEVMVPLSPRLVLIGLPHQTSRARKRYNRHSVAALNARIAERAHRFVYSTTPNFQQLSNDGSILDGPSERLRTLRARRPIEGDTR